jgi:hypothetical protein
MGARSDLGSLFRQRLLGLERNGTMAKLSVFWTATWLLVAVLDYTSAGHLEKMDYMFIFIGLCILPSQLFMRGGKMMKTAALVCGLLLALLLKASGWV